MRTHKSKYFYGKEISSYGLEQGYLDYGTLAAAFDAVLVNDITKLFYADINGEYSEAEQINGYIDNSDEIEELEEERDALDLQQINMINEGTDDAPEYEAIQKQIDEINDQIEELEREQDEQHEIFQYFIISNDGADLLQEYTNDPIFYIPVLDCYVWGVTHWGTSWDYVLTDVKIELSEE